MASDEPIGTESTPVETPQSTPAPESTPAASTPESSAPASFGENLRAEVSAQPTSFTQADFDSRLKAERETWQKAQDEKFAWANGLDPQEVTGWRDAIQQARQNPVEAATQLLAAALASPQHQQSARSFAGRLLAGYTGQSTPQPIAQPQADPEPGPDIPAVDVNGKTVYLYSAEQLAKREAWKDRQLDAKLAERFKPFEQDRTQSAEARARAERDKAEVDFATQVFTRMQARPGFTENQPAIYEAWAKMPGNDDPYTARENLHDAYTQVVTAKYQSAASTATVADQARRASASTGRVVTSQPTQASAPEKRSFAESLAAEMDKVRRRA